MSGPDSSCQQTSALPPKADIDAGYCDCFGGRIFLARTAAGALQCHEKILELGVRALRSAHRTPNSDLRNPEGVSSGDGSRLAAVLPGACGPIATRTINNRRKRLPAAIAQGSKSALRAALAPV